MTSALPTDSRAPRKIFLVGATGGVGRRLVTALTADGHRVTGLHRSSDDADDLRNAGAEPVQGDIAADGAVDLADRLSGHDAVIFCAGAGGDQVDAIDGHGPGKIAQAAAQAGVNRFVLVSVFMDAWRGDDSPGAGFERYMAAKRVGDVDLAASDLDYLIVRPGTLTDDDGTGSVNAGVSIAYDTISRDDVAGFIAASVFTPYLNRVAIEITGGDTPIDQAVASLEPRPVT